MSSEKLSTGRQESSTRQEGSGGPDGSNSGGNVGG